MKNNRLIAQREARYIHRQNMKRTLLERLQVAKASRNISLIEQLELEKKALGL